MPTASPSTLCVSTRKGPITFTTSLTWEEAISELESIAQANNEFALSLLMKAQANKYMSQSQVCWVYKLAQDGLDAKTPQTRENVQSCDASEILGSLVFANISGLKKPTLRFVYGDSESVLKIKYMVYGSNAGGAWVTLDDELVGKIDDQGLFTPRIKGNQANQLISFITKVNANPLGASVSYGRATGSCSCCGRLLTNAQSIDLGIGPICKQKMGF